MLLVLFSVLLIMLLLVVIIIFARSQKHVFEINAMKHCDSVVFPENIVPVANVIPYYQRVNDGFEVMKERSVILTGLVHDLENIIELSIQRLVHIGEKFQNYLIVLYENNSKDGTKEILYKMSSENKRIIIISEDLKNTRSAVSHGSHNLRRFAMMAKFRNKYLEYISTMDHNQFTHVIVADMDMRLGYSLEGVAHTFSFEDWDMVACNGLDVHDGLYYDPLAFSNEVGERVHKHSPVIGNCALKRSDLKFQKGSCTLIPVKSAFAGCAIYEKGAILSSRYAGTDCEHICLHDNMITNGFDRLFINPSFVVIR